DRRVATDIEQDRLRLVEGPQVFVLVGDASRLAALVPAQRLLHEPAAPVGEPLPVVERSAPKQVELDTAGELDQPSNRKAEQTRDLGARSGRDDQPLAGMCPAAHPLPPTLRKLPPGRRTR